MSTATKLNIQELAMRQIKVDHSLQARVETKVENVLDYFNAMEAYKASGIHFGFPPVVVFWDGKTYWLADGFHRFAAWAKAGGISIKAEIHKGTKQEAILFSVSANLEMGFRPTSEDKRKAVKMLLEIPQHRMLTDMEIARRCGTSSFTVYKVRKDWYAENEIQDDRVRICGAKGGGRHTRAFRDSRHDNAEANPKELNGYATINYRGKLHRICRLDDPDREAKVELKREELLASDPEKRRLSLGRNNGLRDWLKSRNVALELRGHGEGNRRFQLLSPDLSAPGLIIRVEAKLTPRSLPAALGDVLLWRQANDPKAAAVVVCYPDDDVKDMIRHAKALGVEFLTPHEVVERFAKPTATDAPA